MHKPIILEYSKIHQGTIRELIGVKLLLTILLFTMPHPITVHCNNRNTSTDGNVAGIHLGETREIGAISILQGTFANRPLTVGEHSILRWTDSQGEYQAEIPSEWYYNAQALSRTVAQAMMDEMKDIYVSCDQQFSLSVSRKLDAQWDAYRFGCPGHGLTVGTAVRIGSEIHVVQDVLSDWVIMSPEVVEGDVYVYHPITIVETDFSRELGLPSDVTSHTINSTGLELKQVDHSFLRLWTGRDPVETLVVGGHGKNTLVPIIYGKDGAVLTPCTVYLKTPISVETLSFSLQYPYGKPIPINEDNWHLSLQLLPPTE